jgi:hypothetical protein
MLHLQLENAPLKEQLTSFLDLHSQTIFDIGAFTVKTRL